MSDSWQVLAKGLQNKNGNLPQIAIAVVTPPLKGVGSFPLFIKYFRSGKVRIYWVLGSPAGVKHWRG